MNTRFRLLIVLAAVVGTLVITLSHEIVVAEEPVQDRPGLYDSNPNHLWNRLYRHLYVRIGPDNKEHGYDDLEPPLWYETTYLLDDQSHPQTIGLLDEFLATRGEKLITDPLKRAMFQRDLWVVFDWATTHPNYYKAQRQELQKRLAEVIRRLALTTDEIGQLPDNYKQAITLQAFPTQYQPDQPDAVFLPSELFQTDGSWVCIGGRSPVAAAQHVFFTSGHSAFLVFMRLPGGREATLAYLDKLGKATSKINPPQFPPGTQVALVRKTILIDDKGEPVASPLTESVQIRVYREGYRGQEFATNRQDFYEFTLRRAKLFDKRFTSLLPLDRYEFAISTFMTHGNDWGDVVRPLQQCFNCHSQEGIHSVLSYKFGGLNPADEYAATQPNNELNAVIWWKQRQYSWGLLEGLWISAPIAESK